MEKQPFMTVKRWLLLLGFIAGIPLFGIGVGTYVHDKLETAFSVGVVKRHGMQAWTIFKQRGVSLGVVCAEMPAEDVDSGSRALCRMHDLNVGLRNVSLASLALGIGLIGAIKLSAYAARRSRMMLVKIFAPGIKFTIVLLAAIVLTDAGIAGIAVYMLESATTGSIHVGLILAVALGAIVGTYYMIRAGWSVQRRVTSDVTGIPLTAEAQPRLHDFVVEIARKLEAKLPTHVVAGLEPNFFATSADVRLHPDVTTLEGTTLYLSIPLLRVMTTAECAAIIGHELAHFSGEDTEFTIRFYPIYAGAGQALFALHVFGSEGARGLALKPALAVLSFFWDEFAKVERKIAREREGRADRAGASVSSPTAAITALLKISAAAPLWLDVRHELVKGIDTGHPMANASARYSEMITTNDRSLSAGSVLDENMPHPTDTHPTTRQRIEQLGCNIEQFEGATLDLAPEDGAVTLLDGLAQLEEQLTGLVSRVLIEGGSASPP